MKMCFVAQLPLSTTTVGRFELTELLAYTDSIFKVFVGLTDSMGHVRCKTDRPQLVTKQFLAFYQTQRFITVLKTARQLCASILSLMNAVHSLLLQVCRTCLIITLHPMPVWSRRSAPKLCEFPFLPSFVHALPNSSTFIWSYE